MNLKHGGKMRKSDMDLKPPNTEISQNLIYRKN